MRNVRLVIRHEFVTMVSKRSFWFMTFLFPLLILGLNVGSQLLSERAIERGRAQEMTSAALGYVDEAGLIQKLPRDVPASALEAFPDRASAQAALEAGILSEYYLLPQDYVRRGELVVVQRRFSPLSSQGGQQRFAYVVNYNLVGDENLARLVLNPTPRVEKVALAPQGGRDRDDPLAFWVPYAVMFLFFFSLTVSSSLMLQSVTREKENYTAEVLLLSLRPRDLMLGKVVGLGLVALLQMIVWAAGGLLFLERGREIASVASRVSLSPAFLAWVVAYFVLGYLMYASALGAIGALAPKAREVGQFAFIVILPLMIPLWLSSTLIEQPNGGMATLLSFFPLTSPVAMAVRLATGTVPAWHPAVGLVGLGLTAYLFVLLAARLFRAETLLSAISLNWPRIWRELTRRRDFRSRWPTVGL